MTISTRLMLGFGVLCLFLIGIGGFSLYTMQQVNQQTEAIINQWLPAVSQAHHIKNEASDIFQLQGQLIEEPSTQLQEEIAEKNTALKAAVEAYATGSVSAEARKTASNFLMDYEAGEQAYHDIVEQLNSGNQSGAALLYDGVASRYSGGLNERLDQLIAVSEGEAAAAGEHNQQRYQTGLRIIVTALVVIVLLAVGLSFWTVRSILAPIKRINTVLKDLAGARGDLSQRIHMQSGDEIETMATNVNEVLETVENMVKHIRVSTAEVAGSSERIEGNCNQLSAATKEISNAIQDLSEKSQAQVERTQDSRELVHAYMEKLRSMAEFAQRTYELAQQAKEGTEQGGRQMSAILQQMQTITEHHGMANESLGKVRGKLAHIEQVNQLIRSVSEQTTILSLNAGIEAARAGTQGKGFAVIADEVRKLSSSTRDSAESIITLLDDIRREVQELTQRFAYTTDNIHDGSEQIELLTMTLDQIQQMNGTVMETGAMTREEVEQMNKTASRIQHMFERIDALSEEQSATSQQISASVEEQLSNTDLILSFTQDLSVQSNQLKGLVEQFQVKQEIESA